MIVAPPALSIRSWWRLVNQDKTLLRWMEEEQIAQLHLRGRVLDIGGGAHFGYVDLIRIDAGSAKTSREPLGTFFFGIGTFRAGRHELGV